MSAISSTPTEKSLALLDDNLVQLAVSAIQAKFKENSLYLTGNDLDKLEERLEGIFSVAVKVVSR